jgi:hypothetical protein
MIATTVLIRAVVTFPLNLIITPTVEVILNPTPLLALIPSPPLYKKPILISQILGIIILTTRI